MCQYLHSNQDSRVTLQPSPNISLWRTSVRLTARLTRDSEVEWKGRAYKQKACTCVLESYLVTLTLRYRADMMAEQRSWIWQYCRRLRKNKIQCNICPKVWHRRSSSIRIKIHLFRAHQIFHDKDMDRNGLIWRYFTEERRYVLKWRICNKFLPCGYEVHILKRHLKNKQSVNDTRNTKWIWTFVDIRTFHITHVKW